MDNSYLHIVSFAVPLPANYGGVIDVFFKIKQLKAQGVKVILHCFTYDRSASAELNNYCEEVHYYPRKMSPTLLLHSWPFIVAGRKSKALIHRLCEDEHPILLEGLHCGAIAMDKRIDPKRITVRSHNLEHEYYNHLAFAEKSLFKKWYFKAEAVKLKRFEKSCYTRVKQVLGISKKDEQYLTKVYGNAHHISAFHPFESIDVDPNSKSEFALYHGNLSVAENDQAAQFLVNEVFSKIPQQLVIAGSNPTPALAQLVEKNSNIQLLSNIPSKEIHELIAKAQINVLPTFQSTGIKLKLLAALFHGKHALVNDKMVEGTQLESLCKVCYSAQDFIVLIPQLMDKNFDMSDVAARKVALKTFENQSNAERLIEILFN